MRRDALIVCVKFAICFHTVIMSNHFRTVRRTKSDEFPFIFRFDKIDKNIYPFVYSYATL